MSASMIATMQAKEITGMTSTSTQRNGCKNAVTQSVEIIIQIFDVWMVFEARGIGVEPTANVLNSRPCYLCEVVVEAVDKLFLVNTEPSGHSFPSLTEPAEAIYLVQREIALRICHLHHKECPRYIWAFNNFSGLKILV